MIHPRWLGRGPGAQSAETATGLSPRSHFPHALFCGPPLSSRSHSPQSRYISVGYQDNALLFSDLHIACQDLRYECDLEYQQPKR
jgi:hypothetical protein